MAVAGRVLDRVVGPEELVGCFNGGLVTWYRPDRVVNLDGRVNRDAFDALLNAIVNETSLAVWHGKLERLESQR